MTDANIKSFVTRSKESSAEEGDDTPKQVTFDLDGREITATRPKAASFVFLANVGGSGHNWGDQMIEMGRFVEACLPKADREHVAARLRDPDDDFDFDDVTDIFRYLMGQFTGRPTESQSD